MNVCTIKMIVTKTDGGRSVATLDADAYSREAASYSLFEVFEIPVYCDTVDLNKNNHQQLYYSTYYWDYLDPVHSAKKRTYKY